ncbi:phosphate ABC transporter permease PstA [Kocuria palustris]|uniref:phosphate ABC transporter permease PstA n=1 Tax=Kocuria palustris TaxID=71999 RepID=UPI0019D217CA|nr:phosphate ABC transporter permease PstA [Kocuria palustris]MBN6753671.1 phosphate ABC transporter permease PstA [Kocuria palustris]MBN6758675.1 phosphate ABC transporter permease PstA [Kocuria palustris]MBN6763906.1 phosphate ABC transporter permease PstA [Kocuria palustris]MBN6783248.1 phosphate ABC transporter permease PstA [Kocuria palustris]MBN6799694.1 phosphate ABC transporter permease PstA [Kocuria palustris]
MSTNTTEQRSETRSPKNQNSLTSGQRPKWLIPAIFVGSIVVGAALAAVVSFSVALWAVFAAVIFLIAAPIAVTSIEGSRQGKNAALTYLVYGAFIVAVIPLISVIWTVLFRGIPTLSPELLTTTMSSVTAIDDQQSVENGTGVQGGILHAIVGSVIVTLCATIISVPIGLLTAIYQVEYSNGNTLSKVITFLVDVMTGIPSIVAGLFASALFTIILGQQGVRMGIVGAVALTVLMIPTVVKSTEEMLKVVPNELREASYALGVRKWRTILKVVIPTAISGIAAGVTLAIARVIGETAPLMVTIGFLDSMNANPFHDWMSSLPTFIYQQLMRPISPTTPDPSTDRAWAAALVLIVFVMLLNLAARLIANAFAPKTAGR